MDLEATAKSLSKRRAFSTKRIAFLAVVGLCLVAGGLLHFGQYFGLPGSEEAAVQTTPAAVTPPAADTSEAVAKTAPPTQEAVSTPSQPAAPVAAPAAAPAEAVPSATPAPHQAEQPELPGSGMILVAKRPVELLASPSSSASVMYGFPAGRPFRVVGREGGFAKIQDLRSGASGWIDATALASPPRASVVSPPRTPAVSPPRTQTYAAPSQQKPATVGGKPATATANPKPKATKKDATATAVPSAPETAAETETAQTPQRPGLFGQGGLFGGIFGNKNQP